MRRFVPLCLSLVLAGTGALAARAAEPAAPAPVSPPPTAGVDAPNPQTQGGITFIVGGVGDQNRDAMRHMESRYNLRLMFAEKQTGQYLADIGVTLSDAHGKTVLDTTADGPLFFAHVPPGRYKVSVTSSGQTLTRSVDVGAEGAVSQSFYWPRPS